MNTHAQSLSAGFVDPVHDAQQAFRAALDALSRPGQRVAVGQRVEGLDVGAAMAHLLLAVTDDDTAVWWQDGGEAAAHWLRFHTGARVASAPHEAAFACVTQPGEMLPLRAFAQGSAASPEFSTTLLIEVPALDEGAALQWHGPGIQGARTVRIAGLPAAFATGWQENHAAFPQGVDVIFTCGAEAIGLPRTTRISRIEGV